MRCAHVSGQLDSYLMGECDPKEEKLIEEHLKVCPCCAGVLREHGFLISSLKRDFKEKRKSYSPVSLNWACLLKRQKSPQRSFALAFVPLFIAFIILLPLMFSLILPNAIEPYRDQQIHARFQPITHTGENDSQYLSYQESMNWQIVYY